MSTPPNPPPKSPEPTMRVRVKAALAGEQAVELLEEIRTVLRSPGNNNRLAQIRRLAGCPRAELQGRGPSRLRFPDPRCVAITAAGLPCRRLATSGYDVCGAHGSLR